MENRIQEIRKENGISQEQLAAACTVSKQTIYAFGNNKYDPTLQLTFILAKVLGMTVDELFIRNASSLYRRGTILPVVLSDVLPEASTKYAWSY
ncbi:helix-turn-helix transcriptional regulator [Paenibacillus sp. PAMC21692]|nr:helix-turn-helix transcriptional regulator [Paenibacillus sp. PAMC21692]